jgi:hypothetical protein
MPTLYIIAGPPGIGKSTNAHDFLLQSAGEILNHDKLNLYYKNKGFLDYEDLSNLKANDFIQEKLRLNTNFGVELNLGLESHYDFIHHIRKNHPNYSIAVMLFFTDEIELCLIRAKLREQSGGHIVEEKVIREMYKNSIPLLRTHVHLINQLLFIHVDFFKIELVYEGYYPNHNREFISKYLPKWIKNNFPEIGI